MATILNRGDGRRAIQFENLDGERKTLGLGKCPVKAADAIKVKLEALISCRLAQESLDSETARWIATLADSLHERLADFGLIEPREKPASSNNTLVAFVESYIAKRTDTKPATKIVYKRTRNLLEKYFGADRRLASVTAGDASDWRRWLIARGLADATVRRTLGFARQFLGAAVDHALIVKNPFMGKDIKVGVRGNAARFHFVSRADAAKILDACPDGQWRLIFTLSRFLGLRCPSEHLALKWGDVDWANNRIRVTSPKTAHHEGKGERVVPLFPELRPHLEAAFDEAPEGEEHVVFRYRAATQNLRTQFGKIITRAGLTPWPKPFHNLRATRQTELSDEFPEHVVCQWLGNSQPVATKHYLHTTDDHFTKAVTSSSSAAPALRNPSASLGNGSQRVRAGNEKPPVLQGFADVCDSVRILGMDDIGLEPTTSTMSTWRSNQLS